MTAGTVAAVAIFATGAFFQDTETSSDNTFTAGKLDLQVDFEGYYNELVDGTPNAGSWTLADLTTQKFFNLTDVKPGDFGEGTVSLHVFDNDAWACVTITPTANDDMGCTEPESGVDATCGDPGPGEGELAQNLVFTIWADICNVDTADPGDNVFQEQCDIPLTQGFGPTSPVTWALADSANNNVFTGAPGPLIGSNTYYLGMGWTLPGNTTDIVQSDKYQADISFYTEQHRNNPGFLCNPE